MILNKGGDIHKIVAVFLAICPKDLVIEVDLLIFRIVRVILIPFRDKGLDVNFRIRALFQDPAYLVKKKNKNYQKELQKEMKKLKIF